MPDGVLRLASDLTALAGAALFLASAIGLLRLPDLYTRMHAPTKAATLGVSLLAVASLLGSAAAGEGGAWMEDLLVIAFLLLTAPLGAQAIARAALDRGVPAARGTAGEPPPPAESSPHEGGWSGR